MNCIVYSSVSELLRIFNTILLMSETAKNSLNYSPHLQKMIHFTATKVQQFISMNCENDSNFFFCNDRLGFSQYKSSKLQRMLISHVAALNSTLSQNNQNLSVKIRPFTDGADALYSLCAQKADKNTTYLPQHLLHLWDRFGFNAVIQIIFGIAQRLWYLFVKENEEE